MQSHIAIQMLACTVFTAAMLHAIMTDLSERRIRNWLVAGLAASYPPLALAADIPAAEIAAATAAAALVFAAGFGCFAAGWVGGGDVKLAAVAILWLGAAQALPFLLLASLLGAVLTAALLTVTACRTRFSAAPVTGRQTPPARLRRVPYGPALAVAAIVLLPASPWTAPF